MPYRPYRPMRGLLALMLAVLSAVPAAAQGDTKTITILQTSDLHANLQPWDYYANKDAQWGLAKVATLVKQERAANPNTLLLDTGDTIQGTPLGYYYAQVDQETAHPMATTMNAMAYDVVALGNHEFNYGLGTLNRWIGEATFPVLSANIRNEDGSEAFTPYVIKDVDGVQVGILGMTTPAIPNWEKPDNIAGLRFDDPIATAQQYVPQMRAEGADVVVVSQHIGWERAPKDRAKPEAWLSDVGTWEDTGGLDGENVTIALAEQVPGIDIILAGHSHLNVPKAVINNVVIAEPSFWGQALSKYTVALEGSGDTWTVTNKDSTNLSTKDVAPDAEIAQLADPYHQTTLSYIAQPVGTATAAFEGGPRARYTDGPLADLINTVQTQAAADAGYPVDVSLAAIFVDSGQIPAGQITLRDAYSTYIYDNTLYVMEINGDILRRALEKDAEYFRQVDAANLPDDPKGVVAENARDYNWDLYTGIDYTIDITKPIGERVTQLQFNDADLQPDQTLRIAINNYRASGGGGYPMFREGTIVWQSTNEVRDLMAAYIQAQGTIDPAAINTKNFTLVPDLYANYFGGTQASTAPSALPSASASASASPSSAASAAPSASPSGSGAPTQLPDTGTPALPLGWIVVAVALVALGSGVALRRRGSMR